MTRGMMAVLAVLLVGGLIVAQEPEVRRTPVQTVDLSVADHEAVMAVAELDPGASTGPHTHSGDEIGYVIDGVLTLEQEGQSASLINAGGGFRIPAGTVHNGLNNSDGVLRALVTYLNPKGMPVTTPVETGGNGGGQSSGGGFFTEEQATRGAASYDDSCSPCHGSDLLGTGFAPSLDEYFIQAWVDRSLGELFLRVKETMPADSPGSLSDDVYADLVAFLLSENGLSPGAEPLSTDPTVLEQQMIPAVE